MDFNQIEFYSDLKECRNEKEFCDFLLNKGTVLSVQKLKHIARLFKSKQFDDSKILSVEQLSCIAGGGPHEKKRTEANENFTQNQNETSKTSITLEQACFTSTEEKQVAYETPCQGTEIPPLINNGHEGLEQTENSISSANITQKIPAEPTVHPTWHSYNEIMNVFDELKDNGFSAASSKARFLYDLHLKFNDPGATYLLSEMFNRYTNGNISGAAKFISENTGLKGGFDVRREDNPIFCSLSPEDQSEYSQVIRQCPEWLSEHFPSLNNLIDSNALRKPVLDHERLASATNALHSIASSGGLYFDDIKQAPNFLKLYNVYEHETLTCPDIKKTAPGVIDFIVLTGAKVTSRKEDLDYLCNQFIPQQIKYLADNMSKFSLPLLFKNIKDSYRNYFQSLEQPGSRGTFSRTPPCPAPYPKRQPTLVPTPFTLSHSQMTFKSQAPNLQTPPSSSHTHGQTKAVSPLSRKDATPPTKPAEKSGTDQRNTQIATETFASVIPTQQYLGKTDDTAAKGIPANRNATKSTGKRSSSVSGKKTDKCVEVNVKIGDSIPPGTEVNVKIKFETPNSEHTAGSRTKKGRMSDLTKSGSAKQNIVEPNSMSEQLVSTPKPGDISWELFDDHVFEDIPFNPFQRNWKELDNFDSLKIKFFIYDKSSFCKFLEVRERSDVKNVSSDKFSAVLPDLKQYFEEESLSLESSLWSSEKIKEEKENLPSLRFRLMKLCDLASSFCRHFDIHEEKFNPFVFLLRAYSASKFEIGVCPLSGSENMFLYNRKLLVEAFEALKQQGSNYPEQHVPVTLKENPEVEQAFSEVFGCPLV